MQLLSKEETAEVAAYLAQSEAARRELAEIQGELAIYAHTVDMHSPPALVRERLMKQVAREKKTVPIDRPAVVETRAPETTARVGTLFGESLARPTASAEESYGNELALGRGAYLTEDDAPKRGAMGKVLPWVGWAVAAGWP